MTDMTFRHDVPRLPARVSSRAALAPLRLLSALAERVERRRQIRVLDDLDDLACPFLSGPPTMFGLDLEGADYGTEAAWA